MRIFVLYIEEIIMIKKYLLLLFSGLLLSQPEDCLDGRDYCDILQWDMMAIVILEAIF